MNGIAITIAGLFALQAPTFRTSTRLVEINVVVHDKNGPVGDLTKDDFKLTDRGKHRDVSVFSVNSVPHEGPREALPAGVFSNLTRNTGQSNVTIVLLDALNTLYYGTSFKDNAGPTHFENGSLAFSKANVMRFVKDLNPNDRVAIYALGKSLRILCDFTADTKQLQKVITDYRDSNLSLADIADPPASNLPTQGDFNNLSNAAAASSAALASMDRASLTTRALMAISDHTAAIPGRKNLIWLTANVPINGKAIGKLLSRSNLAIYPVDARGLTTSFDPHYMPAGQDVMREVSSQTGGRAFLNTNDLSGAIRKAIDDASVSYTLGFYLDEEELDGKFHDVKVHVDRGGLEVRHPSGYFSLPDTHSAKERDGTVRAATTSPLESTAIHVLARADRAGKVLRVSGSIDLRSLHLDDTKDSRKGAVEVLLIQQDAMGKVLDQSRTRMTIAFDQQQYDAALKSGIQFRQNVSEKDHAATLRIIASDPLTTAVGSLIIPISHLEARVQ